VTVYDARSEIGGLVRFAIAPYRQLRDPLPAEAALLEGLGVRFELGHAIESPSALRSLEEAHDACVLAVGLGATSTSAIPEIRARRRLELAAVHRGDQDRSRARGRSPRCCDRRRQHGDRRHT
jgi:NADPH-dependent glutamate synthase beta chain and related oxidoreductases